MSKTAEVLVVGAGIGGLTTAALLAARGVKVTVIEKADAPGGKIRCVPVGPVHADAGPTVFTMKWVFDAIFAAAGASFDDKVALAPANILARHSWGDGSRLDLFADVDQSADAVSAFAGPREAQGYRNFCAQAARTYAALESPFLKGTRPTALSLAARMAKADVNGLMTINPFQTFWAMLGKHFKDQRLQQLFGRYATYCGCSPFASPATLALIAHVEQSGVWLVDGGMHALAKAMEELCKTNGVTFRYGDGANQLLGEGQTISGLRLASGDMVKGDVVVFNGDPAALTSGALGSKAMSAVPRVAYADRSLSAMVWNFHATTSGFPLVRHNVFFSNNYAAEFRDIFDNDRMPVNPTVYVCAQDRDDNGTLTTSGPERLQLIVNAPPSGDRRLFSQKEIDQCETRTLRLLEEQGLTLAAEGASMSVASPFTFERLFPGSGGALYGRASHGATGTFKRPGSRSRVPGLYLAGGATHPGAGVPMAALSGQLCAQAILSDRGLT